jgi:hypothetical protein
MECVDQHSVQGLRVALRKLGAVVAEVDAGLRYVWVENPHPDFKADSVVGKRDDELVPAADAAPIVALKTEAWESGSPVTRTLRFHRSDGERAYAMIAYPVHDDKGRMVSVLTVAFDTRAG